jgi:hypothetical protein
MFIIEIQCKLSQRTRYLSRKSHSFHSLDVACLTCRSSNGLSHDEVLHRLFRKGLMPLDPSKQLPKSTVYNRQDHVRGAGGHHRRLYTSAQGRGYFLWENVPPPLHHRRLTCAAARARTATCSSATSRVKQLLAAQAAVPGVRKSVR